MAWLLNDKEIEAVLVLDGTKRYAHLIQKVADQEEIWSLWQEGGWALASDQEGHQLMPVWPHSKYATLCAKRVWADYQPKSISLDDLLSRWIFGMQRDRLLVAVFPTPQDKGVVVDPNRFEKNLREALSQYE